MANAVNLTLYYGQTQPHCSGSRQRAFRRPNANDVYHRWFGGATSGGECLLCHLTDHNDSACLNALRVPLIDVDATLQPPGWILGRGGRGNDGRCYRGLCFVRWVVSILVPFSFPNFVTSIFKTFGT